MKTLTLLRFRPESTLLFRDTRKFSFSDNARTVLPSVEPIYGAIRTAFLRQRKVDLSDASKIRQYQKEIGDANHPGKLRFIGAFPYLKNGNEIRYFLPTPSHLTYWESTDTFGLLSPHSDCDFLYRSFGHGSGQGIRLHTLWDGNFEQGERATDRFPWIDLEAATAIKKGNIPPKEHFETSKAFFEVESRTGIGLRSDSKNAQQEMIFRIRSFRFTENAGLYVFLESGEELLQGIDTVFLGGKGGVAVLEPKDSLQSELFDAVDSSEKALVLITPAIFKNGFLPEGLSAAPMADTVAKVSTYAADHRFFGTEIQAVSCGKPQPIGGWDLILGKPKPLMHALPAGSTFFVKGNPDRKQLTDIREEFGYGTFIECKR